MIPTELTIFDAKPIPPDVVDLDLWRWGNALADRHQPDPIPPSRCVDTSCVDDEVFPCRGRETADRLLAACRAPWLQRWTTRLDALSCGLDWPEAEQPSRGRLDAIDRSIADPMAADSQSSAALVGPRSPSAPAPAAHRPRELSATEASDPIMNVHGIRSGTRAAPTHVKPYVEGIVMPSAEPSRLTDDLWLAAHDSVTDKPWIGDWPLGVGLATGLLGELVHDRFLELRHGELFRTTAALPDDPALHPLLNKMETEERSWPPPTPPARARAQARGWAAEGQDWPAPVRETQDWAAPAPDLRSWPPRAQEGWSSVPPEPVPGGNRHRKRGHELGTWMSYLAYEQRAEKRVIDRLARAGLVRQEQRRRVFGGTSVRYVPYDSVVSGTPSSTITSALLRGRQLPLSGLFLAGLFLATGLHHHALATLGPTERSLLADQLGRGLDGMSRELLKAADAAVGEAAMR